MAIVIRGFEAPACEECGAAAVHHNLERATLAVDAVLGRAFRPLAFSIRWLLPLLDRTMNRLGPGAAAGLAKIGLVVEVLELDPHSSETTMALWQEAEKRGIALREIRPLGLPRSLFVARHRGRSLMFQGLPRRARWQPSLLWLDDKAEMKKRFKKAGFPVARGGLCATEKQALRIFRQLTKPAVAKPHEGSGGRHVRARINTEEELKFAFRNAHAVSPFVVVEEELEGPVWRATLIDGKLAGVLRRDPPQVKGDGTATVRELAARENLNPMRQGPVFSKINVDSETSLAELARQGLTPESVLPQDQVAYFHFKVNWDLGGTSQDATPETHPENKKLFEAVGAYLGEDIVGIDFMVRDINRSWQDQERCGVIELNSMPHLGNHHYPFAGPVQNVAGAVWEMVYPSN